MVGDGVATSSEDDMEIVIPKKTVTLSSESEVVPDADNLNRTSVFDRLTIDKRLQFPNDATDVNGPNKLSFAAAVGSNGGSDRLQFFPLADKTKTKVKIPLELAKKASVAFLTIVCGYFLGPRLQFDVVKRYAQSSWGKFGFVDAMLNAKGMFFFKFNDVGGANQVAELGSVMIRGIPFFLSPWDCLKGLSRPEHTSCPLWVKFHNIPIVAFNNEGISRLASALGVPRQMDACTASMCDKAWGRPGFAKVLIDVWVVGELKRELEVVIPSLTGGEDTSVKIRVEYLWEPTQCDHCLVFGHKSASCAKAVATRKESLKKPEVDSEGFQLVTKKVWRQKTTVPPSGPGSTMDQSVSEGGTSVDVELASDSSKGEIPVVNERTQAHSGSQQQARSQQEKELESGVRDKAEQGGPDRRTETRLGMPSVFGKDLTKQVNSSALPKAPKPPIKGILKNPNRFNPLSTEEESGIDQGGGKDVHGRKTTMGGANENLFPMFNIGAWNIRGLNASIKQSQVKEFLREQSVSICAILETHVHAQSLENVCDHTFGKWNWLSNQMYCLHGTRIVVAWDARSADVVMVGMGEQFVHCEVHMHGSLEPFYCSFVYGANRGQQRKELWSALRRFKVFLNDKPWVVLGDFNALLFPHDAYGGVSRRNGDMLEFADCIEDVDLFDVQYMGIQYTWCQKPSVEGGILRKLDRILVNAEFTSRFHDAHARFLPRGLSDHSPGLLAFTGGIRKVVHGFKFDNFLVNDPNFLMIVHQGWQLQVEGTFMHRVLMRLKHLKTPLRKLRSSYHNLSKLANSLKVELDVIQLACDLDPANVALRDDLTALRVAYMQACRNDELAARQRAKVRWLREGDSNTRFFHQVVKEKRHTHHIHSIQSSDGNFVYGSEVPKAFVDHLKQYLGVADDSVNPNLPPDLFGSTLTNQEAINMIRAISDDEIRTAMFCIGNEKAPGSDGFTSKFFKKAWSIIGADVTIAIHNFFYRARLAKELNHTLICMLPKVPNASRVTEYRPISCCSVLYKCISKVLVSRMKGSLDHLVGRYQSAFVPGRRIADNILMAHELVVAYHKESGPPRCAFKIDIRKAYDMVDWRYLINVLRNLHFHSVFIKWIEEMLTTPTFSINVNGETHGYFHGKRGIRQGDPLSPYLFTLIMEGFSAIFKRCIAEAAEFGFHSGCEQMELTHLCFADDLFVFTRGDVQSVEVLKKALDLFAIHSGLKANLEKSEIFFGNVPADTRIAIRNCLPFRLGSFPIRYLGVPLSPVRLKRSDYGVLTMKIRNRIQNWKMKFLSFAGRRQLVISVLQGLQLYWMAIYVFPAAVVHDIEGLLREFLWAHGTATRGKCHVAWRDVCLPLSSGGLGFKRLDWWNRALVAKHIWDLVTHRNSLWVTWVHQHSLRGCQFWIARRNARWSWVLSKIMDIRSLVRRFIKVTIGDGANTHAWEDNWITCGPLSSFLTPRFIHNNELTMQASVADLIHFTGGVWPQNWIDRVPILANHPMPPISQDSDSIWWTGANALANFTVKIAYESLQGDIVEVPWHKAVWFRGHIPKHAFVMWMACRKRLMTQDRMMHWKEVPPDLKCSLCKLVMDSHEHLFFQCPFSLQVWQKVCAGLQWTMMPNTWDAIMITISDVTTQPKQLIHKLALSAMVYAIWRERNRRIFTEERLNAQHIAVQVLSTIRLREAWKMRRRTSAVRDDN
ncbi:LOW QUALITY PROTEIN: hypothetical protein OSB04_017611 [Centaurea solstitialis]|uniref:Reverse transcriptase domain-containing protein n=1 Tax=Centaurea solstitialis TaxID=347529 RepID=A0AA38WM62_9ASTR|nr:LOW QUALITY PROTEIN: hypothetical protein OSB04_017611 [Centaurea solstitialis]